MLKNKKERGITLIALVITIVVLLILAGVAISMLSGDNGILKQATKASEKTAEAQEEEQAKLVFDEVIIENKTEGEISKVRFQEIADSYFGKGETECAVDEKTYTLIVKESENGYELDANGELNKLGSTKKDESPGTIEGTGEEDDPFVINSIEDLVAFAYDVNKGSDKYTGKIVTLGRNLSFTSAIDNSYANPDATYSKDSDGYGYVEDSNSETTLKELLTADQGFIPIGLLGSGTYKGTEFNGHGYYLDGLYENSTGFGGLFGMTTTEVKISNLEIKNGNIQRKLSNRIYYWDD